MLGSFRSALQIRIIYVIIHKIQSRSKGRKSVEYVPIAILKVT